MYTKAHIDCYIRMPTNGALIELKEKAEMLLELCKE